MKKIKNVLLNGLRAFGIIFVFALSACSSQEDNTIVGAWQDDKTPFELAFSKDGNYVLSTQGSTISEGKYTVDNNKLTISTPGLLGKEITATSTFTIEKNKLIVVNPAGKTDTYARK